MKLCFSIFISLYAFYACGQQTTFQKAIGINNGTEEAQAIKQTADGGFIIAGQAYVGGSGNSICLVKTNGNGDTLWTKTIIGQHYIYNLALTSDGGYALTGIASGFNGVSHGAMFLLRTDVDGNFLWEKLYPTPFAGYGQNIKQTTDGGFIIAGQANIDSINYNAFLVKTDANGDTLWTRNFGGTYNKYLGEVCQTSDNGYIVVGENCNTPSGNCKVLLFKLDSNGNLLWAKTYGGTSSEVGTSIQITADGSYILAGFTNSFGLSSSDVLLIKTDSSGNVLFAKTYGSSLPDAAWSVSLTSDGGYFICGSSGNPTSIQEDPLAIRTDAAGNLMWSKKYGYTSTDRFFAGQQTSDGGFIMAGGIWNYVFGRAIYLVKADQNGATGCFWEQDPVTIVGSPVVTVSTPVFVAHSGAIVYSVADSLIHTINGGDILPMCFTASISETNTPPSTLEISPNPATSEIKITTTNSVIKDAHIYTMMGQCILQSTINNSQSTIDISALPAGMYIAEVISEKGVIRKRVVKQ